MKKLLFISAIALSVATLGTASAANKLPVTAILNYSAPPGGNADPLLTTGAITDTILAGFGESGIPVFVDAPEANVGIQINLYALYSQPLDNLRVVSGSFAVRIPRPGAKNFSDAFGSCQRGFFVWTARTAQEVAVQRIKAGLRKEAQNFARQCRSELMDN